MNTDRKFVIAEVVCSSPRKKQRISLRIGERLMDIEVNFAQQLLQYQLKDINRLCSTLLQVKALNFINNSLANRIQIIHCVSHGHWIVATTINSKHDTVKVYDSFFHYLDKNSLWVVQLLYNVKIKYHK